MGELFHFVSNGKELIAAAITDKGLGTESSLTFDELAKNILNIPGAPVATGRAVSSKVDMDTTFLNPSGGAWSAKRKYIEVGNLSFKPKTIIAIEDERSTTITIFTHIRNAVYTGPIIVNTTFGTAFTTGAPVCVFRGDAYPFTIDGGFKIPTGQYGNRYVNWIAFGE